MTVKELIAELQRFDGDDEVVFSYNYGDYWRTNVGQKISSIEEKECTYSAYHRMLRVHDDLPDEEDGDPAAYVVIS